MTVIDHYLQKFTPEKRKEIERLFGIVRKVVPDAKDVISYGMPALSYKGKAFFGFNVHSQHIGIYPYGGEEIEVFKDKLKEYGLSKGAIRVPLDKQFPEDLLKEMVAYRIKRLKEKYSI